MLTNADLHYHFHPAKGWLNDPNGLSYFHGRYHLFFQHLPGAEYPDGSPMHWGHAVTEDFLHYTELSPALAPDRPYDAGGVWSGTATEIDGTLYLFYASRDAAGRQTVSVAFSRDGTQFEKYAGNPVIRDYPPDGSADFRDPAVLVRDGRLYLVIASADKAKGTGNLLLYTGTDPFHWTYAGVLREYENCRFCECPSFVPAGDGYLLSVSVCPKDARHYFEVMYGAFDGRTFSVSSVSHFQKGPDEYAGQIFHAPDGRNLMVTWVPGWDYQPKEKCVCCLSLPLELTVREGRIAAFPAREVRGLLDENGVVRDAYLEEAFAPDGSAVTIRLLQKPE